MVRRRIFICYLLLVLSANGMNCSDENVNGKPGYGGVRGASLAFKLRKLVACEDFPCTKRYPFACPEDCECQGSISQCIPSPAECDDHTCFEDDDCPMTSCDCHTDTQECITRIGTLSEGSGS